MTSLPVLPTTQQVPSAQTTNNVGPSIAPQASTPPASPEAKENLKNQWTQVLQKPEFKAALAQFGVNLLQPRAPGQTELGAVASAFGAGGAAAKRVITSREERNQAQIENARADEELAIEREGIASQELIAGERIKSNQELARSRIGAATALSVAERNANIALQKLNQQQAQTRTGETIAARAANVTRTDKLAGERLTRQDKLANERITREITALAANSALDAKQEFNEIVTKGIVEDMVARNSLLPDDERLTAVEIAREAQAVQVQLSGAREKPTHDRLVAAFKASANPDSVANILSAGGTNAAGVDWTVTPEELEAARAEALKVPTAASAEPTPEAPPLSVAEMETVLETVARKISQLKSSPRGGGALVFSIEDEQLMLQSEIEAAQKRKQDLISAPNPVRSVSPR